MSILTITRISMVGLGKKNLNLNTWAIFILYVSPVFLVVAVIVPASPTFYSLCYVRSLPVEGTKARLRNLNVQVSMTGGCSPPFPPVSYFLIHAHTHILKFGTSAYDAQTLVRLPCAPLPWPVAFAPSIMRISCRDPRAWRYTSFPK